MRLMYNMSKKETENISCLDILAPDNAKIVFVGTITSQNGMEKGLFYSSSNNDFYKLLDGVLKCGGRLVEQWKKLSNKNNLSERESKNAIEEIEKILKENQIAIFDMVLEAERPKNDASDKALRNIKLREANDIVDWLNQHGNPRIVCTSKKSTAKQSAEDFLIESFNQAGIEVPDHSVVPSPSRRAARFNTSNYCDFKKTRLDFNSAFAYKQAVWEYILGPYIKK